MARQRTVFSIGYEKAGLADFIACLDAAGVKRVLDLRDLPLSRRAGFSKRQLAAALEAAGIGYVHLKALGTPPEGREANRSRDMERFWRIVDDKMAGTEAGAALEEAAALAAERPTALLCYEADWRICHRKRVEERLAERGFRVQHLAVAPPE